MEAVSFPRLIRQRVMTRSSSTEFGGHVMKHPWRDSETLMSTSDHVT
jgi:hypothetical protein